MCRIGIIGIAVTFWLVTVGCTSSPRKIGSEIEPTSARQEATQIASAITPGMTEKQVGETIKQIDPFVQFRTRFLPSNDPSNFTRGGAGGFECYDVGQGVNIVVKYNPLLDIYVSEHDTVDSVQVVDFNDLLSKIPADLFSYVKAVHVSATMSDFDPTALIRAVNALQPLGKEKALRVLREYGQLLSDDADQRRMYGIDDHRMFWVARLLFVRTDGVPTLPRLLLGGAMPMDVEEGDKDWPLFPLALQDDIPFCMATGYMLAGLEESPEEYLEYCEKNCSIRSSPLKPSRSPLVAVRSLANTAAWRKSFPTEDDSASEIQIVQLQALRTLHRCPEGIYDPQFASFLSNPLLLNAKWDERQERFIIGE